MSRSIVDSLALLDEPDRAEYVESLDADELQLLLDRDWSVIARPEQFLPDLNTDWFLWFIRAGRGWGKSLVGAHAVVEIIQDLTTKVTDGAVRVALGAPRHSDLIKTMLEGETGIRAIIPPSMLIRGSWEESITRGSVPELRLATGAILQGFPATVADGPRGPQFHAAWCDEPGSYADASKGLDDDTFMSNLLFGLRLPPAPRLVITGTPKNNRLIKDLRKMDGMLETHGRTSENLHNLAEAFKLNIVARYAGRRLGRQELDAEIIEGIGVMFQRGWFQPLPLGKVPWPVGQSTRTVRYWDLAASEESDAYPDPDWTVGTKVTMDPNGRLYLIEDVVRFRATPGERDRRIREVAAADGLPVTHVEQEGGSGGKAQVYGLSRQLDDIGVSVRGHRATGSKGVRAEPYAGACEQHRVWITEADWNDVFLDEHEEFHPDAKLSGPHDDHVDSGAGAFEVLRGGQSAVAVSKPAGTSIPKPSAARGRPVQSIPRGAGMRPR